MEFANYTMKLFNNLFDTNWKGNANTDDFLEYLDAGNADYMYASYDKEDVIREYREYLNDVDATCDLICIDNKLYIAMY